MLSLSGVVPVAVTVVVAGGLVACAASTPKPKLTPEEAAASRKELNESVAKIYNDGKPLPDQLPPYPTGADEPQDKPGCKEKLKVKNHQFSFRPKTIILLKTTQLKPWVFIRHDINPAGKAVNARIEKSAGLAAYDQDAMTSLKRWNIVLPQGKTRMTGCMAKFRIS